MKRIECPSALRQICDEKRREGDVIGLVPTMGALHEGHLRLIDEALQHTTFVIVSIFVNPTQFGPDEDYENYPRRIDKDADLLKSRGAHALFCPSVVQMYSSDAKTIVSVKDLTSGLCGAHRAGHFDGVTTIVAKLFNIAGPCTAIFGRKDYQQLLVIERMVRDLHMPVNIVSVETVREQDGLAMSSRNAYLSTEERQRAQCIPVSIARSHALFAAGASFSTLQRTLSTILNNALDAIDYIAFADPESLIPHTSEMLPRRLLIAIAGRIGRTRLIDNTVLGEDSPPQTTEMDLPPSIESPQR